MIDLVRKLRRLLRVAQGRDLFVVPTIQTMTETLTSLGAPWTVAPAHLDSDEVALTFGIGTDLGFELALASRFNMTVHAFDPTPRSGDWIRTQRLPDGLKFHAMGLSAADGVQRFEEPELGHHVSFSAVTRSGRPGVELPVKRLHSIARDLGDPPISLLKMDIEGSEYAVIDDMPNHQVRPTQILIEFHHRFANFGPSDTRNAITTLRSLGYEIAHVASNGEEFLFLKTA